MAIVALDKRLGDLIDLNAEPEVISPEYVSLEGPVWHHRDRHLIFTDLVQGNLYKWTEKDGVTLFREKTGVVGGTTYDLEGNLLCAERASHRISRTLPDGTIETVVDNYKGRALNHPNDLVVAANGDILFTDPVFTMRNRPQEYPYRGVFRWRAAEKRLQLLIDNLVTPNGIAITNDGKQLIVSDSVQHYIFKYDIEDDGSLSKGHVFINCDYGSQRATPDGMKIDLQGNIYVGQNTRDGMWIYSPRGDLLGTVGVGENVTNMAWGDDDWQTLYLSGKTHIYRMRTKVPGQPVGLI